MTGGPTEADVRRLLDDARAVVAAVGTLPAQATDPADAAWLEPHAGYLQERLADLEAVVQAADGASFPGALQAIASGWRPLDDTSPSLQPARDPVFALFNQLTRDNRAILDPHVVDGRYTPEAKAALAAALSRIAGSP